jgi:hypothetical protein
MGLFIIVAVLALPKGFAGLALRLRAPRRPEPDDA